MAQARARSKTIIALAAAAGLAVILAVISSLDFSRDTVADEIGQIILPRFVEDVSRAEKISVVTSDESYSLEREGDLIYMAEKNGYPIRPAMLADLYDALAALTYEREMTRDPRKFDQLGLGDPTEGGAGALFQIEDADGDMLVDLIVGFKNGDVFVRRPDDDRAWKASSQAPFPPLQRAARWLELDVLQLTVEDIARTEIEAGADPVYGLIAREDLPGEFDLAPPFHELELISDFAPNAPGGAMGGFAPINVIAMEDLHGAISGRHRVFTHDGLVIDADLYIDDAGRFWATFSEGIEAETLEAQDRLDAIEARVAGWAFEVSRLDHSVLLTRLTELASDPDQIDALID